MAAFLKPDNLNIVWASGGDRLYPGDTKYASGWGVEIPPRQYFNEIDYKQDQMLAHINQRGIAEWDVDTEYQADKSYTQSTTGTIYRCILTHTGQNPDLDVSNTYWEIAFANAGDFYTKTEGDGRYAQLANNGSDFVAETFRTNLSLYSKAETYTQAEVNAKTTVASVAQAQAQASNTVLLSALRLADAFKGGNYSINTTGFQKLPSGLILQWGRATSPAGGSSSVITLPTNYQLTHFITLVCEGSAADSTSVVSYGVRNLTVTDFTVVNRTSGTVGTTVNWISIGI